MDKRQVEDVVTDTAAEIADTVQGKLDQGKGIFQDLQAGAGETIDKATALVRDMSTAGGQAVGQVGDVVQGVAREVRSQAGQAAATAYQRALAPEGI